MDYLSQFAIAGSSQVFRARILPYTEDVKSLVTLHVPTVFENNSAWGAMATLLTWKYSVREVPGAATISDGIVVQVLGGPGFGQLDIATYYSWYALLADMRLEKVHKSGLIFGTLSFVKGPY
jgi:hypothetical protein